MDRRPGAVDAVVWNGLERGEMSRSSFLDVKTGPHARLTSNQRRIREAIMWRRIAFDVYARRKRRCWLRPFRWNCRMTRPCLCPRTGRMMRRTSKSVPTRVSSLSR